MRCLTVLVGGTLFWLSTALAHAACPVEVDFPFVDLDGNFCHDPTDSGDVTSQIDESLDSPFAPPAGSLVCPAGVQMKVADALFNDPVEWFLPASIVIGCRLLFNIRGSGFVTLSAAGDVVLREGASMTSGVTLQLLADDTVSLASRTKVSTKGSNTLRFEGHDVVVGDQVKLETNTLLLAAEAATGTLQTGSLNANAVWGILEGGAITLGPRTKVRVRADLIVRGGDRVAIDQAKLNGGKSGLELKLSTPGTIALTNSFVRFARVAFTAPPGSVCDVTGTDFGKATTSFAGCTVVGP